MINWYLNRLKTMSFAEVPYRVKQFVQKLREQSFEVGKFPAMQPAATSGGILTFLLSPVYRPNDYIYVFGKKFHFQKQEIDWHQDIFTGERFPMDFSKSINIRSTSNISAKNVWEINRLQFLPTIALQYKSTGSEVYLQKIIDLLSSWIDQNPYLSGVNWYSNIEVNIRLITWFLCWEILEVEELMTQKEGFRDFVENKWLPSIYQHCQYAYQNPSKFSSANNHLIAEYAGLFVASALWQFKESEKWFNFAQKGLEKEIQAQHSSGVNKEEAAEYIQFITDFFLLPFVIGRKINRPFSKSYKEQLRKIFYYIYHFLDSNGHFPKYGDEDDGNCFSLDLDDHFNNFESLLTAGAILFNDPVLKYKSNGFDLKNNILFGEEGRRIFEAIPDINPVESSMFYQKEGHFIFKKREQEQEIYLHFDVAPLGFLSIAAHGHADALSFLLHVDGCPIFIDSGTYTYHTEPQWRKYFIGTLAHNTIRVNEKDQAESGGPTLWIKHYRSKVLEVEVTEEIERVKATHNGYDKEGVQHIREVVFDKLSNEFQIIDTIILSDDKPVTVDIPFHLHPQVSATQITPHTYLLSRDGARKTTFSIDKKLHPQLVNGQLEPEILGWYSNSFLQKESTSVLFAKTRIECHTSFKFIIKIA